jgi:hypothetical protein
MSGNNERIERNKMNNNNKRRSKDINGTENQENTRNKRKIIMTIKNDRKMDYEYMKYGDNTIIENNIDLNNTTRGYDMEKHRNVDMRNNDNE